MLALKAQYDTVDMRTILDRQIAILKTKRVELPESEEWNRLSRVARRHVSVE